jgi:hypothetical protein
VHEVALAEAHSEPPSSAVTILEDASYHSVDRAITMDSRKDIINEWHLLYRKCDEN